MPDERKILFEAQSGSVRVCVEENTGLRTLHFDNGIIQSQIDLNSPVLPLKTNRMMLAHLLFGQQPQTVLLAGCGGGTLARWFNHYLPGTTGIGVEINPTIIDLAKRFFDYPPESDGWQLEQADIRDYLKNTDRQFDFILFDIEENAATPDWLFKGDFLQLVKRRLTEQGVVTLNLIAESAEQFAAALWPLRQLFPYSSYCLSDPQSRNLMLTAFNNRPDTHNLADKASEYSERFAIEFESFLARMRRDNPPGSGVF